MSNAPVLTDILAQIKSLRSQSVIKHPIPEKNLEVLNDFFSSESDLSSPLFESRKFASGVEIVHNGKLVDTMFGTDAFAYAEVPLGIILHGNIVVTKDGTATKSLVPGDFIGLFETADWLQTGKARHIGDWSLTADSDVVVLFFSNDALKTSQSFRDYLVSVARTDSVPKPISDMPLLDWVAAHTTHKDFDGYAVLTHTHLLPSNLPLFRHLAHLVGPKRMFMMDKPYSTVPSVTKDLVASGCDVVPVRLEPQVPYAFAVQKSLNILWESVVEEYKRGSFKKLLILDDGADVWLSIPNDKLQGLAIAGIEQTQRGITRINAGTHSVPPVVSVASSGVKKIVESDFIGGSVATQLRKAGLLASGMKIGIVGAGSIGRSIAESALSSGCIVSVYDPARKVEVLGISSAPSLDTLLNDNDLIIGTTGSDALRGVAFDRVKGRKILVSASSSDIEFGSLLKIASAHTDPFGTVPIKVREDLTFELLNGGFPFNFDRLGNASDEQDIVLTRCLLYARMMQARDALESQAVGGVYSLDKVSQENILKGWIAEKEKNSTAVKEQFRDIDSVVAATVAEPAGELPSVWKD